MEAVATTVELPTGTVLQPVDGPVDHVDFITAGLASLIVAAGREKIEVGIVGREGYSGIGAVLGVEETTHETVMQIAGSARRVSLRDLGALIDRFPDLRDALLKFAHVTFMQASQTALANGRRTVEQRLARWLLMADDRIDGAEIALTHEFLAVMLGVRRPGVTVALHVLEGEHAIRSRRNSITVTDREKLKAIAGPIYGTTEAFYERLFAPRQTFIEPEPAAAAAGS